MASSQYVVGLDIGSHSTRVVVSQNISGNQPPTIITASKSPTEGIHHGYVINKAHAATSVKNALTQAQKNLGTPIREVMLALGGISLTSRKITQTIAVSNPATGVAMIDIERAISSCERRYLSENQNTKVLHCFPIGYALDGKAVLAQPVSLFGNHLSVSCLVVSIQEHHYDDHLNIVNEAGYDITDTMASPLATSLVVTNERQRRVGCAVVDIGAETVSLVVYENGVPISLEVFKIGSSNITNDIALGFRIDLDQAERIKVGRVNDPSNQFPKNRVEEIVTARVHEIFELVSRHLASIGKQYALPAGVVLTGGGSILASIDDMARVALSLPTRVPVIEASNPAGKRKLPDQSWFTAYGLCVAATQYNSPYIKKSRLFGYYLKELRIRVVEWFRNLLP